MKKVSIITVTYNLLKNNREDLFRQMFESLHAQTYPNIEHVIIDGNSTDGTQDFIKNLAEEIGTKEITLISEPDNGINDATNKGFSVAKGDYLMLMCSDDYYMCSDAVELLVNACEKKNADFACGDCWWLEKKVWKAKPNAFVYKHPFVINTLLMKKDVFNDIGGLDDEFGVAADYEFFFKLLNKYNKYAVVHKTLTALRPGGISGDYKKERNILGCYYKIYEKYYSECKFTKREMNCLVGSYSAVFSVGLAQILKIIFFMKNSKMKWLLLRHYNIFYYLCRKFVGLYAKLRGICKLMYLIIHTELL